MIDIVKRIRRHLADPASQHRQIAVGFLWVSAFVFLGKIAGAAKEMAIAWRYGVSAKVDAYVFVFNLVNWPVAVWLSVLTIVLVPLAVRLRHDTPEELPRFRAELLGLTLLIGAALGLLAWWGLPLLLQAGWLGLSSAALAEALGMAGGLAMLVPLGVLISLFSVWLLAAGRHRNTLFEAIPAATLLVALLLPSAWVPEPLLWGTVTGFALHAAALALPLQTQGGLPLPRLAWQSPAWHVFWGGVGVMGAGQFLVSLTDIVDQFFAATLGHGALATLSYATRVLSLVLGMGAVAIGRATLPVFSRMDAEDRPDIGTMAFRWARWMYATGFVTLLVGWMMTPLGIEWLFQRGAFTERDTHEVAAVLRLMLLQVPFYFGNLVLIGLLAARKHYALIALSGMLGLVWKLLFAFMLVPSYRLNGLVLSTVLMYVFSTAVLFFLILKTKDRIRHAVHDR